MTRMTGPDCVVMCNLINTYIQCIVVLFDDTYYRILLLLWYCTVEYCVCVCFLPIHSGHQVRWTYQPGSHRRKVTQDF